MPPELPAQLGGLAALLALSAFFSGSETALFSLSRAQVQRLREAGGRTGRAAAMLLGRPRRLLITILVGNMLVNVASASLVASVSMGLLGSKGVGLAIGLTTFLLLVFGEITPKTFAVRNAAIFSRVVALPLLGFGQVIFPIRIVLRGITAALLFVLRQGHVRSAPLLSERELQAAVEAGAEEGVIDAHELEMLERIFAFRDLDAREAMVPRTEMAAVAETATVAEALDAARASGHSRLPVFADDVDEVWGVFDVRDLPAWRDHGILGLTLRQFVDRSAQFADAPKRPLVRPAFLVPETRHVGDLMQDMRQSGEHMAILLDEYGGTAGLVTLRMLVDELVGGVLGQGRSGEPLCREVEGRLQVLGEARLREVCHDVGLVVPEVEADTVGGYVMSLFGRLPRRGETIDDGRYRWRVLRMVGRRIDAVEVTPLGEAAP